MLSGPTLALTLLLLSDAPAPDGNALPSMIRGRVMIDPSKVADLEVAGPDVDRFVLSRKAAPQGCYEKQLKLTPTLKASLKVDFQLTQTGRTGSIEVVADPPAAETLRACVATIIRGWAFPFKPAKDVSVALTMRFVPAP